MRYFLVSRLSVLFLGLMFPIAMASGQNEALPPLDVVILVDVSASVISPGKWESGRNGHQQIVKSLIMGDLRERDYEGDWTFGSQSSSLGKKPLVDAGQSALLMKFGAYETTTSMESEQRHPIMSEDEFRDYFDRNYPSKFGDKYTHFDLAQAIAYDKLKGEADGYYLIVVSDEENDTKDLVGTYVANLRDKMAEWESASDAQKLAVFSRKDTKLKITVRKVGHKAKKIIARTPAPERPESKLNIQLLGGLNGSTRENPHHPLTEPPFFAWQVNNSPEDFTGRSFEVKIDGSIAKVPPDYRGPKFSFSRSWSPPLAPGDHTIKVVSGSSESPEGYFRVKRPKDYLMEIAILSGLLSLGVFIYTWWMLRQQQA